MNYAQVFVQNMHRILDQRGKTLNWLATQMGKPPNTTYQIKNPTIKTMEEISNVLEIPLICFLDTSALPTAEKPSVEQNLPRNHIVFSGVLPELEALLIEKYDKKEVLIQEKN